MSFKRILVYALSVFSLKAQALIPNELGQPRAGGLPRESSEHYEILYGSVRVGKELQRVIVTNPSGQGPKPALLFIGGMGCYSLDFSGTGPKVEAYQKILDFVASQGFVTMRVEKTGMGDSVGTACANQDFQREVAGNLAGLKALASYSFVDAKQIYVFGHSIGGVIAPRIATEVPVKAIAVFGSLATSWADYDLDNSRRQSLLSGESLEEVETYQVYQKIFVQEFYVNKKSPQQILSEHPRFTGFFQLGAHWTYMQQLSEVDPVKDWSRLESEVLIISGATDFIGSQEDELLQMVEEVNKSKKQPARFFSIKNMDHFFRRAESQQASFRNQSVLGLPLSFQSSILTVLQNEFLAKK